MTAYYNENNAYCAEWLRMLILDGQIAPGDVDERSIVDVTPLDVKGYTQCHFFAGLGGWSYALRLAGWSDELPVWTGSCPCQPFSVVGKMNGMSDSRHLWPVWYGLLRETKPTAVFGEQVEKAIALGWLDQVADDMEREGYAFGAHVLPACAAEGQFLGQRIHFVCVLPSSGDGETGPRPRVSPGRIRPEWPYSASDMLDITNAPFQSGQRYPQPIIRLDDDGLSAHVAKERTQAAGNAIYVPLAAEFIRASMEAIHV